MRFQAKRGESPTTVDRMRGRLLQERLGGPLSDLSSAEWFALAEEADGIYRDIGPFDPAAAHFIQRSEDCLNAASFVETFPGVTPR